MGIAGGSSDLSTACREKLTEQIVSGQLAAGEKVPPVRELAAQAGVNPNTMQRALAEMEREGLMFTNRTSGRYVTEDREMIGKGKSKSRENASRNFCPRTRPAWLHRAGHCGASGETQWGGEEQWITTNWLSVRD